MVLKKIISFVLASLFAGFLIGYLFSNFPLLGISKEGVGEQVRKLYTIANPAATIEVVTITEESGIYKVVLKARDVSGTTYREVYATKDGKLLTENLILVEKSIQQIESLKNFVDCLEKENVKIYGLNNQTATLLQLNILGIYSGKLYVSCDVDVKRCTDAGVQQVPSVVIGESVSAGIKATSWFEQQTKCKLA